jgi:hypothetical protein
MAEIFVRFLLIQELGVDTEQDPIVGEVDFFQDRVRVRQMNIHRISREVEDRNIECGMGRVRPKSLLGFGIFAVLTIISGSPVPVSIEIFERRYHVPDG